MEQMKRNFAHCSQCPGIGIIVGAISGILYSTSGAFTKLLSGSVDPGTTGIVRSVSIALFGFVASLIRKTRFFEMSKTEVAFSTFCGILVAIFTITWYYACQMIDFADVMTLVATCPMFVILINAILFKTKPTVFEMFTVIVCSVSIILCTQPHFIFHPELDDSENGILGKLFSLTSAFSIGLVMVLYQHNTNISYFNFLAILQAVSAVILIGFVGITHTFKAPNGYLDYVYLLANGLVSIGSVSLYFFAVKIDSALMAAIGRTADVAAGLVFDVILFNKVPNDLSIFAAILLIISIIGPPLIKSCKLRFT